LPFCPQTVITHKQALTELQRDCDGIIRSKTLLLQSLVDDQKHKDEEYVKELKKQADEVDAIMGTSDAGYKQYQQAMQAEIEEIERTFMLERKEMLERQRADLEDIAERRRSNERCVLFMFHALFKTTLL
jgi:dynein regulatory complex protein 1